MELSLLLTEPVERPGHEFTIDYPCCTHASMNCGCMGTSVSIPCDCEECQELYQKNEREARNLLAAEQGPKIIDLLIEILHQQPPLWEHKNHKTGTVRYTCRFCGGPATYYQDWIRHTKTCVYAQAKRLLGMEVDDSHVHPAPSNDPIPFN